RRWLEQGRLEGLRIDHVDGLQNPEQYLQRLRELAPRNWIVVEKILQSGESLASNWPVAGTTGYDFLNRVGGLFVDPTGEKPLTDFYAEFTGQPIDYPAIIREKKRLALRQLLAAEVNRLTAILLEISARYWQYRDFTSYELQQAIVDLVVCFPVYRTYVQGETGQVSADDVAYINGAAALARQQGD